MKRLIAIFYTGWFLTFIALMCILKNIEENTMLYNVLNPILGLTILFFPASICIFCILKDNLEKKQRWKQFNNLSDQEKREYYERKNVEQNRLLEAKSKRNRRIQELKEKRKDTKTIIKTMIVGTDGKVITDSNDSLIGGLVGGALFGTVGAIAGATSGDKRVINKTTFLVKYADGHKKIKTVKNNSYEFNKLCKYLEM